MIIELQNCNAKVTKQSEASSYYLSEDENIDMRLFDTMTEEMMYGKRSSMQNECGR